jgi:hypothetical protein
MACAGWRNFTANFTPRTLSNWPIRESVPGKVGGKSLPLVLRSLVLFRGKAGARPVQGRCNAGAMPVRCRCNAGAMPVAERPCTGVGPGLDQGWSGPSANTGVPDAHSFPDESQHNRKPLARGNVAHCVRNCGRWILKRQSARASHRPARLGNGEGNCGAGAEKCNIAIAQAM